MSGPTDKGGTIDLARDHTEVSERQVDTAALAAGQFYGTGSLDGVTPAVAAAAEMQANLARQLDGAENFIRNAGTGGTTDSKTRAEREQEEDERSWRYTAILIEEEERRREEEWDRSNVRIGSVAMTGEEWDEALESLSDPAMRDKLITNARQRHGWSQSRAEKAADDALTLAEIARKKKNGTMTAADQTKAEEITSRNPDAAVMVQEAAREKFARGLSLDADASSPSRSVLSSNIVTASTDRQAAIKASAASMVVGADPAFASVPKMVSHFDEARAALTTPPPAEPRQSPSEPTSSLASKLVARMDMDSPF